MRPVRSLHSHREAARVESEDETVTDRHGIGRRRELEVAELMKMKGIIGGYWQPPRGKFAGQDIFGLFDVIALAPNGVVVFVQIVKDRSAFARPRLDAIAKWVKWNNVPCEAYLAAYRTWPKTGLLRSVRLARLRLDGTWFWSGLL